MYFYFYDTFLADKKYTDVLSRIETRTLHLGLQGKIERCALLKNAEEIIAEAILKGYKNIIAVGDDASFYKVMKVAAGHEVTIGFIPIGKESVFARVFGIPMNELACDTLSKRVIENLDLGKINDHYFFSGLKIEAKKVSLRCDDEYTVHVEGGGSELEVCNIGCFDDNDMQRPVYNAHDGFLDTIIHHAPKNRRFFFWEKNQTAASRSIFPVRKVRIEAEAPVKIVADGQVVLKTPVTVTVAKKKIKMIVGKDRLI